MSKSKKPPKWKIKWDNCYFHVPKAAIRDEVERFVNKPGILEFANSFDICRFADKMQVQPPINPSDIVCDMFYIEPNNTTEDISNSDKAQGFNSLLLYNLTFNTKCAPDTFGTYLFNADSPDVKPEKVNDSIIYSCQGIKFYCRNKDKDNYTFHHFLRAKRLDYLSFIWTLQLLDIFEDPVIYAIAYQNENLKFLESGQKIHEKVLGDICDTHFRAYCFRLEDAKRIAAEDDCAVVKIRHPKYTTSFAEATIEDIILPKILKGGFNK